MNQWHPRTVYSKIKPDNRKSKSMAFKKNAGLGGGQVLEQIGQMNHTLCDSFGQFPLGKTTSFIPTDPAIVHFHH